MSDPEIARLLDELARAIAADAGVGLFLADSEDALRLVASHPGGPPEAPHGAWLNRVVGRTAGGRGAGRPGGARAEDPEEQLIMAIPDGQGGVLVMGRTRGEPFGAQDRALARLYARQVAVELTGHAVDRSVGPAGPAWRSQLQLVQAIASRLTRLTTIERIGEAICAETRRVVPYDNARLYVLASDGVTLDAVAFSHHAPEYAGETAVGLRLRLGQGITGSIVETGRPVVVTDAQHHPHAIPVPGTDLIEEALMVVPLVYEGMPRGAIVLCRLGRVGFRQDELRLIQVLADQAVVAVENARSLALRDRMVHELQALLEISRAGADEHDEHELAGLAGEMMLARHAPMRRSSPVGTSRAPCSRCSRRWVSWGPRRSVPGRRDRAAAAPAGPPGGTPHLVRSRSSRVGGGARGCCVGWAPDRSCCCPWSRAAGPSAWWSCTSPRTTGWSPRGRSRSTAPWQATRRPRSRTCA
ncbi:MAG: GAF domain-containing protein [Chloroflexota bacterium]